MKVSSSFGRRRPAGLHDGKTPGDHPETATDHLQSTYFQALNLVVDFILDRFNCPCCSTKWQAKSHWKIPCKLKLSQTMYWTLKQADNWSFLQKYSTFKDFFAKLGKVINFLILCWSQWNPVVCQILALRLHLDYLNFLNFPEEHAPVPPPFLMPSALIIDNAAPILHIFTVKPQQGKINGTAPVELWETAIDQVKRGKFYHIENIKVKVFNDKLYQHKCIQITEIDDIKITDFSHSEIQQSVILGAIIGIDLHGTPSYITCNTTTPK